MRMTLKVLRFTSFILLLTFIGGTGFILGALTLGEYSPNMLLELVSGETPQAKITGYLTAIQAQDRVAAIDAWALPAENSAAFKPLSERRDLITDELLALQIKGFTIFEPQWWRTCCDPGVSHHARNAGGARVQVQVLDAYSHPQTYTFDVFTNGAYFGDAAGNPYRYWFLRDVYPHGELPIFWPLVYSESVGLQ